MHKPIHTLAFLVALAFIYLCFSFLLPKGELVIGKVKVHIPGWSIKVSDNNGILANCSRLNYNADDTLGDDYTLKSRLLDTVKLPIKDTLSGNDTLRNNRVKSIVEKSYSEGIEYNSLKNFIESLNKTDSSGINVLYYGDSQIEGDRITDRLRVELQKRYGGVGVGALPYWNPSFVPYGIWLTSRSAKHIALQKADKSQRRKAILGAFSEIEPSESFKQILELTVSSKRRFPMLNILVGDCDSIASFKLMVDGKEHTLTSIKDANVVDLVSFKLPSRYKRVSVLLKSKSSLKLYGVFASSGRGVFVSNIALRGSSGNFFTEFDSHLAKRVYSLLNVRLVVLQFGINVVPSNLKSYNFYKGLLVKQINAIKSFAPNASIIVVGVSDMAGKFNGVLESYPSVLKVRDAQQQAASECGVAFWDAFAAMGGKGSMIEWVNQNPSLATKDYTHFTYLGAKRMGDLFSKALINTVEMKHLLSESKAIGVEANDSIR
jgi:lysophospholipase L1-like esterase